MKKPKWMDRFWKDFTQKEFVSIKILYFLIYGGMTTLYPFLTIQAKSLGMTVDELGIVYSILPVIGILAPGIVGMFADSIGNFKIFLCIMMSISGLTSLLFLAIPQGRIVHDIPEELSFSLNCSSANRSFQIKAPMTCDYFSNASKIEINIKACKYTCTDGHDPQLDIVRLDGRRSFLRNITKMEDKNNIKNMNKANVIVKTNTNIQLKRFKTFIKETNLEFKNNFNKSKTVDVDSHSDTNKSLINATNFNKTNITNYNEYGENINKAIKNRNNLNETKVNEINTSSNYLTKNSTDNTNNANTKFTYENVTSVNVDNPNMKITNATNRYHDHSIVSDTNVRKNYSNEATTKSSDLNKTKIDVFTSASNMKQSFITYSSNYVNYTNINPINNYNANNSMINKTNFSTNEVFNDQTRTNNFNNTSDSYISKNTAMTFNSDGNINTTYVDDEVDLVTAISNVKLGKSYIHDYTTNMPLMDLVFNDATYKSFNKSNINMVNMKKEYVYESKINTLIKELNKLGSDNKPHLVLKINVSREVNKEVEGHLTSNYDNTNDNMLNTIINIDVTTLQQGVLTAENHVPQQLCPVVEKLMKYENEVYNFQDVKNELRTYHESQGCFLQCDVTARSKSLCNNTQSTENISPGLTMIAYILVRLVNSIAISSTIPLFEGAAVAILKQHNGDFGYQRMYANLGKIILTPISGKLIDVFSAMTGKEDFRPAFFIYCSIKIICAIIISFMSLEFKKPSKTVLGDVKSLIFHPRVILFLIFSLVTGMISGLVDTFLFWFLEDMKADRSLMGLTITIGAIFGLPFLLCSTYIIKRLGHIGTLSFTMATNGVRILGYSFIYNPWLALPFEVMKSFANSLRGVASISYISVLSTPSTLVSLQGIHGGTSHGIGRGAGSLVGGFLIKSVGSRTTFQIAALVSALSSAGYFSVHWFSFRKKGECSNDNNNANIDKVEVVTNVKGMAVITNISDDLEGKLDLKYCNGTVNESCEKSMTNPSEEVVISNENLETSLCNKPNNNN